MHPVRALKLRIKSMCIGLVGHIGPRLRSATARRWLCDAVVPALMDDAVLPFGLVDRPLRRIPVSVPCNPYVYVHRSGYWCGVFFEEELEAYMLRELKPGDTVLDIGANVGHVALPAGALVAPTGCVYAFEPNPQLATLVAHSAARQRLPVTVHPFGLGDQPGTFELRMEPGHAGGATLRPAGDKYTERVSCSIKVGDEVMPPLKGRVFLKIDVEGFEINVLRGLQKTLRRVDHAVLEVSPEWLGSEGVRELFALLQDGGLVAHRLEAAGTPGASIAPDEIHVQSNVLFIRA
jgi:FkbM family methyltransferase